jgi:hypothetical protein
MIRVWGTGATLDELDDEANRREVQLKEAERVYAADTPERAEGCADPCLVLVLHGVARGQNLRNMRETPHKYVAPLLRAFKPNGVSIKGPAEDIGRGDSRESNTWVSKFF